MTETTRRPWQGGRHPLAIQVGATLAIHAAWAAWVWRGDLLPRLVSLWPMTLTMVAGSFIGGATCEGGGAVAFPALTLVFGVEPPVARTFALAIQSVGMTMATLVILLRGIPIERLTILWGSLGGAVGMVLGTFFVAPHVPSRPAKLLFVSIWLAFGIALFLLNRERRRPVAERIERPGRGDIAKLLAFGTAGGVLSSVFGSGLNDLLFCLLTLHFRVSEKVATPTSVVLMAINALIGTGLHGLVLGDVGEQAAMYWLASVPVVVIFAPLGAILMAGRSRHFVSRFLYVVIVVQFVGALVVLRPSPALLLGSALVVSVGVLLFALLSRWRRAASAGAGGMGEVEVT